MDCILRTDVNATPERLSAMARYVPFRVVKSIGLSTCCFFEKTIEKLTGTVVYFDIKNFTVIVNSYIMNGKDVAELRNTLSDYYSIIIEQIRGYGGSVFQFAGDSILICFEQFYNETAEGCFSRALATMLLAVESSHSYNAVVEKLAGFSLNPKIGIGCGDFYQMLLGGGDQYLTPVVTGDAVNQAIHMEEKCEKPEIVLSSTAYKSAYPLGLEEYFEEKDGAYHLIKEPEGFVNSVEPPDYVDIESLFANPRFYNRVHSFLSESLFNQIKNDVQGFSGEYRTVTCCMVRFDGVFAKVINDQNVAQGFSRLNDIYNMIQKIAVQFDSYCGKPDLSDKGTVFPVFFGTHGSFENRERTAILFANNLINVVKKTRPELVLDIGIASGDVYAGEFGANIRKDFTIVGNTINYAARLMMKAMDKGNFELFIDKRTTSKCKLSFELDEISGLMLKGFAEPQTIYRFRAIKTGLQKINHKCPLLGREAEMATLSKAFDECVTGKSVVMPICGETGVGKSYLASEFVEKVSAKYDDVNVLYSRAYLHEHKTSLYLWRDMIKYLTNIREDMDGEELFSYVQQMYENKYPNERNWSSYFLSVMGYNVKENPLTAWLSAAEKQQYIFSFAQRLLVDYAKGKKLIIVLDDIQWADSLSLHLLAYLFTHSVSESIFVIALTRKTEAIERLFNINHFNVLNLHNLTTEHSIKLAEHLLNFETKDEDLIGKIITLSGGNPWYINIIVESLVSRKALLQNEAGHYYLAEPLKKIKIPYMIHDLIMSEVGSLAFDSQIVCKNASVVGTTFSIALLSVILPKSITPEILQEAIEEMTFNNLIFVVNEQKRVYSFKNNTIRSAIYDSIVESMRKSLNRSLLRYFEKVYKNNIAGVAKLLAYYAQEAKDTESLEKYKQMMKQKS